MKDSGAQTNTVIKLAIMAVGGQGGGVLTRWVETLARAQGFACQATSVAGVAQRTGATIYYVEMAPKGAKRPVFSLAPAAGDVDIVIAAELMEAGRAILRGFVTPDKTTLIASTHRALAISEKTVPGDGISNPAEVYAAAEIAAARFLRQDMEALAFANGSVISATLFGALAASNALPFPKEAFEDAIRASGKGVEASLRAFETAFSASLSGGETTAPIPEPEKSVSVTGSQSQREAWAKLVSQVSGLPDPVQPMALAGLSNVVAFMDADYGADYLDYLARFLDHDSDAYGFELTSAAAKYLANAMAYDDVIRVADLKTRGTRVQRISREMNATDTQVMQVTEFLHPRAEEIVGMMPARMGRRAEGNARTMARIERWFGKGRRLRSDRLGAFLMLYVLGGLKRYRRSTYRHSVEQDHLGRWVQLALTTVPQDYDLAVEILRCRRLIKGYSDTHARGLSKFDRTLGALEFLTGRDDAADWLRRLRDAALQDEQGEALDGAIKTIKAM